MRLKKRVEKLEREFSDLLMKHHIDTTIPVSIKGCPDIPCRIATLEVIEVLLKRAGIKISYNPGDIFVEYSNGEEKIHEP